MKVVKGHGGLVQEVLYWSSKRGTEKINMKEIIEEKFSESKISLQIKQTSEHEGEFLKILLLNIVLI